MNSSFGRIASRVSAVACAAVILIVFNLDAFTRVLGMNGDEIQTLLLWILFAGLISGVAATRELPQGKRLGSLGGVFSLIKGGLFLGYSAYALLLSSGQK